MMSNPNWDKTLSIDKKFYLCAISIKGDFSSLLISQILRPSKDSPLNKNEDSFDLNLHCSSFG